MTERKPAGVPVHTWVDRLIREAEERGEFDHLPGAGKPLPGIDRPLEEDWWIRQKLREEDLPTDGLLPPALQLRREVANLPETVRDLRDEDAVRAAVIDVNQRVTAWIRRPSGPVLPVVPADLDAVLRGWREARAAERASGGLTRRDDGAARPGRPASAPRPVTPPRRRAWWRRWRRRG